VQNERAGRFLDGDAIVRRRCRPILTVEGLVAFGGVVDLCRRADRRRRRLLASSSRQRGEGDENEADASQVPETSL
jgi:hypothetical protein